jgi:molecular chaperone DnaJ
VTEPGARVTSDYYEVLGVPHDADPETIKKAFRARARALHPDVSRDPDAPERFRELSEAYAVLSKPPTRLLYDHFGYRGRGNGWFTQEGARTATDFLRRRARPVGEVLVDAYEARRGVRRRVEWTRVERCAGCDGDGAAPGATTSTCPTCDGTGRRRVESSLPDGERLLQIGDCPTCGGRGGLVSAPCPVCGGSGAEVESETAEVDIPPATVDGDRVPVADGAQEVVIVRVLDAADDQPLVRYLAVLGLLVALVFLWVLLR